MIYDEIYVTWSVSAFIQPFELLGSVLLSGYEPQYPGQTFPQNI